MHVIYSDGAGYKLYFIPLYHIPLLNNKKNSSVGFILFRNLGNYTFSAWIFNTFSPIALNNIYPCNISHRLRVSKRKWE